MIRLAWHLCRSYVHQWLLWFNATLGIRAARASDRFEAWGRYRAARAIAASLDACDARDRMEGKIPSSDYEFFQFARRFLEEYPAAKLYLRPHTRARLERLTHKPPTPQ